VRKVVTLLAAIVLFTAPLTITALAGWYAWRELTPAWPAIQTVVLINVLCVVFVTHVYETVFLIKEREDDRGALSGHLVVQATTGPRQVADAADRNGRLCRHGCAGSLAPKLTDSRKT